VDGDKPHPSIYRGCSRARKEIRRRRTHTTPKNNRKGVHLQLHNTGVVLRGGSA
jgi:hypothetical protein